MWASGKSDGWQAGLGVGELTGGCFLLLFSFFIDINGIWSATSLAIDEVEMEPF